MTNQPGGFWRRLVALVIDGGLIWVAEQLFARVIGIHETLRQGFLTSDGSISFTHEQLVAHSFIFAFGATSTVCYALVFYRWKNATLGKLALGLKVVDAKTGARLGIGQTILRESIGRWISIIPLLGGYVMVLLRRDKRGLHDLIAGTQVQRR